MKKKIVIGVAVLSMAMGFVGCTSASVSSGDLSNHNYVLEYSPLSIDIRLMHDDPNELHYEAIMLDYDTIPAEQSAKLFALSYILEDCAIVERKLEQPYENYISMETTNDSTIMTYEGDYAIGNPTQGHFESKYIVGTPILKDVNFGLNRDISVPENKTVYDYLGMSDDIYYEELVSITIKDEYHTSYFEPILFGANLDALYLDADNIENIDKENIDMVDEIIYHNNHIEPIYNIYIDVINSQKPYEIYTDLQYTDTQMIINLNGNTGIGTDNEQEYVKQYTFNKYMS